MTAFAPWAVHARSIVSPTGGTATKQLYFASFLLGFTVLISLSHGGLVLTGPYLAALGVLAVATVLALTVRWESLPLGWGALVPVLDMVSVGLVRDLMRESSTATSLLVLIPALWMAARLRLWGVAISVVAVTALITAPSLVRASHIDSLTIAHALLLPFTVLQIGLLTVGALALLDGQNRRLAEALTEKQALLEGAASSQRLLQNIIDSVDVGIVVVDEEGDDLLMNRAQRRIHALATPAHIDDPDESQLLLRHPGTTTPIPAAQRPVRRAVLQESFDNYLVEVGPLGEGISFSSSGRQILDGHGHRAGAVVVFSDVTSYLETVRSQERFVAAVSHELRTPLTSVIGYLELAREDETLDEQTSGFLDVAHRNADQLLLIVQDLLADQVSRAGTEELTLRPRRLSEIARRAVESAAPQAREAGIVLEADLEDTPELPLDEKRVQQALGNLLSNALKYTPQGGRVHVRTSVRGNQLELSVVDTGIGMSMQEQAKLFTEYYRTRAARDSAIAGHGIGLALTRRIVVAHGGQISVRSRPGRGSTFTLRFALDGAETVETAAGRPSQAG
ncbi:sensor histidine kinase [Brachybacterium saurashtrense]|uniref:histidine kinase n=1 Tax=Brachybacterium saurashtrense TaxID=556288 RepID=A0A345YTL3_9MICO|nr:sensor histidine kinase [Brachybacterium saurashtrense]AXK47265.1 PAS domain-containing sensor histidine kinase [Brachybacterium saurashtrense]RRR24386.1 PAS domain-containing sensor histidine kinase [Brachybacterium saurashtrense]